MQGIFLQESLHKAPEFFLISWYGNIVERHVSPEFWSDCSKLCRNCIFPQIYHTRKVSKNTVSYAVNVGDGVFIMYVEFIFVIGDACETNV